VDKQVVVETHAPLPADARLASGKPAAPVKDGAQSN
jgi:hypothetical protein